MVEIITLDKDKTPSSDLTRNIENILGSGGLIVYPTSTLYGLGASIFSKEGVEKLMQVKQRPHGMPLSVFIRRENITDICDIPVTALPLLNSDLALTFVLPAKSNVPSLLIKDGSLAVRFPDSALIDAICKTIGPITATSANRHGKQDPTDIQTAIDDLGEEVGLYLDSGATELGQGSTIVDLTSSAVRIIREGIIPEEQVMDIHGR